MPHATTTTDPTLSAERGPRRSSQGTRLTILGVAMLLMGPLGWTAGRHELAAWQVAAALEARLDSDWPRALRWADCAVAASPRSIRTLACRATVGRETGDTDGSLAAADRLVQLAPHLPLGYRHRMLTLQQAGRWQQALGDVQEIVELASKRRPQMSEQAGDVLYARALNERAYARALAGVELDEGLKDIELAIELAGPHPAFLDTRGYLHFRLGNLQPAHRDLELAMEHVNWQVADEGRRARRELQATVDQRHLRRHLRDLDHLKAVVLHHRGLVYLALGRLIQGQADLVQAQQLGYDPSQGVY